MSNCAATTTKDRSVDSTDAAKAAGQPLVKVESVTKVYEPSSRWMHFLLKSAIDHPVRALEDVSIELGPGQLCAVVGPNGAGKSTLFRILMGLTTPTSGRASILGYDVTEDSRQIRSLVGFMPAEDRTLFLRHTSFQNLYFHGRMQGIPARDLPQRIDETLEMVGILRARNYAGHAMSTGMRSRLLLARALLHRPPVLILDEPTGAVDPIGAHQLLTLIQQLAGQLGVAVLLSSHRLEEIDALQDLVLFLDKGQLVHWGNLQSLRQIWELPRTLITFDSPKRGGEGSALLEKIPDVVVESNVDSTLTIASPHESGYLLTNLDCLVGHVVAVTAARMPLRDLLAKLVSERN